MNEQSSPFKQAATWLHDHDLTLADLQQAARLQEQAASDPELHRHLQSLEDTRRLLAGSQPADDDLLPDDHDAFTLRLVQRLQAVEPASPARQSRPWWPGGTGFKLVATVLILAGVSTACFLAGAKLNAGKPSSSPLAHASEHKPATAGLARYLPASPEETRRTLREVWDFYDGKAGWIAMTGDDVRVGLAGRSVTLTDPVVASLSLTGPEGRSIKTDIALVPGQEVMIHLPLGDQQADDDQASYRLKLVPDAAGRNMLLHLTVTLSQGVSLATTFPLGHQPVREVGRLLTDRGDYQLHLGLAAPAGRPHGKERL